MDFMEECRINDVIAVELDITEMVKESDYVVVKIIKDDVIIKKLKFRRSDFDE